MRHLLLLPDCKQNLNIGICRQILANFTHGNIDENPFCTSRLLAYGRTPDVSTSHSFVTICYRRVCTNSGRKVAIMPKMNMMVLRVYFSLYTTTGFVKDNGENNLFLTSPFPSHTFPLSLSYFDLLPSLYLIPFRSYRHSFPPPSLFSFTLNYFSRSRSFIPFVPYLLSRSFYLSILSSFFSP